MKPPALIILFLFSAVFTFPQTKSAPRTPANISQVAASMAVKEAPQTLGTFRRQFLGQEVMLNAVLYSEKYCLQWETHQPMIDSAGMLYSRPDVGPGGHISINYRGQTGTVVSIDLSEASSQHVHSGGKNAFGESIGEDDIVNPRVWVVVKLKDGTLAMTEGPTVTIVPGAMELASSRLSLREDIESNLPAVIGRKLYAVGDSHLYKPTATIDDLSGRFELLARLETVDVPLLAPLIITKAKYLPDVNAVLMKLSLPSGIEAIAYTPSTDIHSDDHKGEFLARVAGTLLASIPRDVTPREIEAIKAKKLFRGMSKAAVDCELGFYEEENYWGRGGTQRIYYGGKVFVYLNSSDKVEDWQIVN